MHDSYRKNAKPPENPKGWPYEDPPKSNISYTLEKQEIDTVIEDMEQKRTRSRENWEIARTAGYTLCLAGMIVLALVVIIYLREHNSQEQRDCLQRGGQVVPVREVHGWGSERRWVCIDPRR